MSVNIIVYISISIRNENNNDNDCNFTLSKSTKLLQISRSSLLSFNMDNRYTEQYTIKIVILRITSAELFLQISLLSFNQTNGIHL